MKKILVILSFLFIQSTYASTLTDGKNFGLGFMLGQPTGLVAKQWIDETSALQYGLAYAFGDGGSLQISTDYLYHLPTLFTLPSGKLPFYFGIGYRIRIEDRAGIRVPVGVTYTMENFKDAPFEFFGEGAPIIDLAPDVKLSFNVVVGARFFF